MRRPGRQQDRKPKSVSYELIDADSDIGHSMHVLLNRLVVAHHPELVNARIALAWCTSWKPDTDGRLTLGKCRKVSDLDRQLHNFDFIILLLESFWTDLATQDRQRAALLDHELCHAGVRHDSDTGEPVVDEQGRQVYRIRRHDIEEFAFVVSEYGCYKRDLELFEQALRRGKQKPLLEEVERQEKTA